MRGGAHSRNRGSSGELPSCRLGDTGWRSTSHPEEARAYLLDLWERQPGSGEINLELARLVVRAGDDMEAKRYYDAAIYGIWEGDASQVATSRRETRLELFHYLAQRNEITNAQSVLMAIAAGLQPDASAELHTQLGDLMLETGMPARHSRNTSRPCASIQTTERR